MYLSSYLCFHATSSACQALSYTCVLIHISQGFGVSKRLNPSGQALVSVHEGFWSGLMFHTPATSVCVRVCVRARISACLCVGSRQNEGLLVSDPCSQSSSQVNHQTHPSCPPSHLPPTELTLSLFLLSLSLSVCTQRRLT